jgi:hypothetical protein
MDNVENTAWNKGYRDGYNRLVFNLSFVNNDKYDTAYWVGKEDREADEKLVALNGFDFDDITEEERLELYDKHDRV